MILTSREIASGQLSPETLSHAVQQIRVNGYIVFDSVLAADFIADTHAAFMELFYTFLQDPPPTLAKNHYRMFLPFRMPFADHRIVANSIVHQVLHAVMGNNLRCHYFASNTCLPGSEYQAVHSDIYPLFPDAGATIPPYHMVLNIPLVDSAEENGAMEIYPGGTHYSTYSRDEIAKIAPSLTAIRAQMPAGSIMIRDGRMWHRGTPNQSDHARPNIALVYTRKWVNMNHLPKIEIPKSLYDGLPEDAQSMFQDEVLVDDAASYAGV
jgi:ectoine hydroxylase-related dioxygenase (phytanoyl-CoA dioxygenase family)